MTRVPLDPPAAHVRAASGRDRLLERFGVAEERLRREGRGSALRSFRTVVARGRVAINMPIPKLVRVVEEGAYLNIYEFVARDTGLSGADLEREVGERLGEFGPLRLELDRLFHFEHDTHYAALNLGGAGALRYGCCCVVFDLRHWAPFHTCFAGDSIRTCCTRDKKKIVDDEVILLSFAIGEDAERLAVIQQERFLGRPEHCVDPLDLRSLLEADDSLIEIHLHGSVTRDRIQEIRLSRADYRRLRDLEGRFDDARGPLPWIFDEVEPFRQMLEVLDRFEIPLVIAEPGRG